MFHNYHTGLLGKENSKFVDISLLFYCRRRIVDTGREFYVCFQDSIPQSAVELAFRLHFGSVD